MPNENHGNPANITNKTFANAADAEKQPVQDAKLNTYKLLGKVLSKKRGIKAK